MVRRSNKKIFFEAFYGSFCYQDVCIILFLPTLEWIFMILHLCLMEEKIIFMFMWENWGQGGWGKWKKAKIHFEGFGKVFVPFEHVKLDAESENVTILDPETPKKPFYYGAPRRLIHIVLKSFMNESKT